MHVVLGNALVEGASEVVYGAIMSGHRAKQLNKGGSFVGRPFLVAGTAGSEGVVVLYFYQFALKGSSSREDCSGAAGNLHCVHTLQERGWAAGRVLQLLRSAAVVVVAEVALPIAGQEFTPPSTPSRSSFNTSHCSNQLSRADYCREALRKAGKCLLDRKE